MNKTGLVTGYVCECCGAEVTACEVIDKRSECCGFACVEEHDFVEPLLFTFREAE